MAHVKQGILPNPIGLWLGLNNLCLSTQIVGVLIPILLDCQFNHTLMSSFGREVKLEQVRFSHFSHLKTHFTVFWLEKWDYLPGTSFTALPKPFIKWFRWTVELDPPTKSLFSNRNPFYCVSARKMRSGWRYQFHCPTRITLKLPVGHSQVRLDESNLTWELALV